MKRNEITQCEGDYVSFDGINHTSEKPTVRFRIAARGGLPEKQAIIDKNGNVQRVYHVKVCDIEKRRRKLLRQGIDPVETDRAIEALILHKVEGAPPRYRFRTPS
jgi:hypothetical protein